MQTFVCMHVWLAHMCAGMCTLWVCLCECVHECVGACIGACICIMVMCGQKKGGKLSLYACLHFRVTSTAAELTTSSVMLILKYYSVPTFTESEGWQGRKKINRFGRR